MQRIFITILIVVILALIFALQNTHVITIDLWFWRIEASLALVLVFTFTLGALLSYLFSLPLRIKSQKQINKKEKRIDDLENKILKLNPEENL